MRDEAGALRQAIQEGHWRALLAPGAEMMLTTMAWADPAWWQEAWQTILDDLRGDACGLPNDDEVRFADRWSYACTLDDSTDSPWLRVEYEWTVARLAAATNDVTDHRHVFTLLEKLSPLPRWVARSGRGGR